MESNQDVASNNIVEREVQPPKPPKRKKKMSFAVWWALHPSEELKMSTENMEQQDSSLVTENGSSAKALQKVDQKGDGQPPESESNENNQVPFKTCSEEDILTDQEISAGNIEKQNNSLVSAEESIVGVQETVDTTEKEQPSKSEEQPPKTRRNKMKVKMIPWSMWLEKHPPAELRTSGESTGTEDDSLVTEQESISVLNETPEKEESSKSSTENVINQDTSLPEEEGDQEDSFKTEICKEELVSFTSEPVTEELESLCKENVSGTNIEQEVSTIETIGDQTAFVKNDIHTIETEISKEQQVTEEKTELETVVNPIETDQHLIPITKTTNPDSEKIPDIPQIAPEQTETIVGTVSEDVTRKVDVKKRTPRKRHHCGSESKRL
ncbi:uncharacterized protein LOC106942448 isoform X2 [Poecilia latipinna]|uniref:uncharacterized protein LOC106942448 isoform X2 n=1 Tax=Poecilia latipinna TaxID=48699 RepID=UPI00072D9F31|nr:PREDICTED: uncharacterized protein LOC106942448 isoform X2 [Poecilia latipinna]